MKIFELFQSLLEYNRDITLQKMAKQLQGISATTKLEPADVLEQLENIDPTKNKQYVPWLVKQLAANQFRLEDRPRINKLLTDFLSIKNRLPQEQRDLGRLSLYQLDDIVDKAMNADLTVDSAQTNAAGTFPVVPGSRVLYNGPLGQLAIPETEEASCELGRGTKWCTAAREDNMFSHYTEDGPLYVWRDKNGEKYQFHFESMQFMDAKDRDITGERIRYFAKVHPVISKLFKQNEHLYIEDARTAYRYAKYVLGGPWPEAEHNIIYDNDVALAYLTDVKRSHWSEFEEPILSKISVGNFDFDNIERACEYSKIVFPNNRWPEFEEVMLDTLARINRAHGGSIPSYRQRAIVNAVAEYSTSCIGGIWSDAASYITDEDLMARYHNIMDSYNELRGGGK